MNRIDQLQAFLRENPDDAFLTHALALEYRKAGDAEGAVHCFKKNLLAHPDYLATYYHYGQLLARSGSESEAIDLYKKGMELAEDQKDTHAYNELRSVWEELTF